MADMNPETLPTEPVPSRYSSQSWFPDIAVHDRDGRYVLASSRAMPVFTGVLLVIAVVVSVLPWDDRVMLGSGPPIRWIVAGGIAWGGLCVAGVAWFRDAVGQQVIVSPHDHCVSIESPLLTATIPLDQIAGVQLCRGERWYQTNLVYRTDSGHLRRHALYSHSRKAPCRKLAQQYQTLCGFRIFDSSEPPA